MKQINVKLLAILFLSTLTLLIGAFVLYRFQQSRNAEGLLVRAETQIAEGDYREAVKYLGRYLRLRKDDDEQWVSYALTMQKHLGELSKIGELNSQSFHRAYAIGEEALRRNPDHSELRRNAVDFSMKYKRFPDAISHLKLLMKNEGKDDPELQVLLALCFAGSGQDEKAVPVLAAMVGFSRDERAFDLAKATAPESNDAYGLLAQIYAFRLRDDEAGNMVIDQLVKANPESFEAHLKRARYYMAYRDKRYSDLIDDGFNRALELEPENPVTLLAAAGRAMQTKQFERAKKLYESCLVREPENVAAFRGLASWALNTGDTRKAISYLNKGLEINENSRELLWARVNIELEKRQMDAVTKTREQLEVLKYDKPYLEFLDGRIDLANGDWFSASKKLEESRLQISQYRPEWLPGLDSALSVCYEKMKQHDLRLKAIRRVVEANPSNLQARWGVVQAMLALGQRDKASSEYSTIEKMMKGTSQKMAPQLLSFHLRMELLQQSRLPETRREYRDADAIVEDIKHNGLMNDPSVSSLVQAYFLAKGDSDKAAEVKAYRRKTRPNDPSLIISDVREVAVRDGLEAALAKLNSVSNGLGDPMSIRMLRCELLARTNPEEAKKQLRIIEADLGAVSAERRVLLVRGVGRIYLLMNELDETRRVWEELAKDLPQDVGVRLSMFELALRAADEEAIAKILDDIEGIIGKESAEWKWVEGVRIAWRVRNKQAPGSELDQVQSLMAQAIVQRDGWEALYRLSGEVHVMKNETELAIEKFEKSLQLGSGHPLVIRNLARLYYDAGRFDDAERMVQRIPASQQDQMDRRIQMDILARRNELPEDLPYNESSDNPADHIWVAKLLTNARRYEEAEVAFRRAIDLLPSLRETWISLVKMQVASGQKETVRQTMRDAELKLSEKDIPIFLGEAHGFLRDFDQSADNFRAALQADPDNASLQQALAEIYIKSRQNEDAIVIIDGLLKDAVPHDPGVSREVRWARQTKAQLLALNGPYHEFTEARKLIEHNAPKGGLMSSSDLVLWARLSSIRPDGLSREQAITKLEEANEQRDLTSEERRVLADLYQRQNRWTECKSVMLDLLSDSPNDMALLDPWLQWLLKHDEEQEATRWLDNCVPNSITELRTRAHLDARRGNSKKAVSRLAKLIPKKLAAKDAGILNVVAQIVEQMGEYDPKMYGVAEKVWRQYVKVRPEDRLMLAAFLNRQGDDDVAEALRLCGDQLTTGKPLAALQLAVDILRRHRDVPNLQQYRSLVRGWFDEIGQSRPNNLTILIQRAEFEDVVGDFKAAEKYLREYMNRTEVSDRQRAIVANNLAYMLSLRGETDEPFKLIEFSMQILGPTADLRDTLGMVYLAKGDVTRALEEFEAAIGDGGATPYKYLHVAMAKQFNGDEEGAAEAIVRAHELGLEVNQLTPLERTNYDQLIELLMKSGAITEEDLGIKPKTK